MLDEPNANLDDVGVLALIKAIVDLKQRGATIFIIAHQRNVVAIADRVLVLRDGVIEQFGKLLQTGIAQS